MRVLQPIGLGHLRLNVALQAEEQRNSHYGPQLEVALGTGISARRGRPIIHTIQITEGRPKSNEDHIAASSKSPSSELLQTKYGHHPWRRSICNSPTPPHPKYLLEIPVAKVCTAISRNTGRDFARISTRSKIMRTTVDAIMSVHRNAV